MNYIYDVLLNYKNIPYDFYEWNNSDNILHVRKIPLIKVSANTLLDIKNHEVLFEQSFLEYIKKKTEIFTHKNIKIIDEACILCDGTNTLAIMLKNDKCLKSKLLIDEEEEVLSISTRLKEQEIKYDIRKKIQQEHFKTRKQSELELQLKKQLTKLFNQKNIEELKYIYYECFNKKEEDINKIRTKITYTLKENNENIIQNLKNVLKLLEIKH